MNSNLCGENQSSYESTDYHFFKYMNPICLLWASLLLLRSLFPRQHAAFVGYVNILTRGLCMFCKSHSVSQDLQTESAFISLVNSWLLLFTTIKTKCILQKSPQGPITWVTETNKLLQMCFCEHAALWEEVRFSWDSWVCSCLTPVKVCLANKLLVNPCV